MIGIKYVLLTAALLTSGATSSQAAESAPNFQPLDGPMSGFSRVKSVQAQLSLKKCLQDKMGAIRDAQEQILKGVNPKPRRRPLTPPSYLEADQLNEESSPLNTQKKASQQSATKCTIKEEEIDRFFRS